MAHPLQMNSKEQRGSVLLEALIAILIFSMGILAIVGLQAAAVQASSEAKYRTEASLLANQLISQMWISDRTPATLKTAFSSPSGAAYTAWLGNSTTSGTVLGTLPGASATVTITTTTGTTPTSLVTVTISWKAPSEPASNPPHKYTTIAQIV